MECVSVLADTRNTEIQTFKYSPFFGPPCINFSEHYQSNTLLYFRCRWTLVIHSVCHDDYCSLGYARAQPSGGLRWASKLACGQKNCSCPRRTRCVYYQRGRWCGNATWASSGPLKPAMVVCGAHRRCGLIWRRQTLRRIGPPPPPAPPSPAAAAAA